MQLQGLGRLVGAHRRCHLPRGIPFGRRALLRAGRPSGSRPVLALSSWNVRELLARHTSSVVAWFQGLDGRQITAYVSPEAAQRLYQGGITFTSGRCQRSHRWQKRSPRRSRSRRSILRVRSL